MIISFPGLLVLILILSVICGVLLVLCTILICKYYQKRRENQRKKRNEATTREKENNCLMSCNSTHGTNQQINNNEHNFNKNDHTSFRDDPDDVCRINIGDHDETSILLNVFPSANRRYSDNGSYSENLIDPFIRNRSVSQIQSSSNEILNCDKNNNESNENEAYRKNSFHLRPFDLAPQIKGKMSHSMEFISRKIALSYDQLDERKVHSFDSDWIRFNSKTLRTLSNTKLKTKELSKSLMSFLKKKSKLKSKALGDNKKSISSISKITKGSINDEPLNDLDLTYTCPFQMSKNHMNSIEKKGSLESSLCISSLDSCEMHEAFLAVSREIHNSCDSDLCFKSATVKRKQFYRDKRKQINTFYDASKSNAHHIHCYSANQSMERDYSIDEKSSAIFTEFLRNDPSFDKFVMEENVRQRLRSERGYTHYNQHQNKSKASAIDSCKSASFTDGDPHPLINIHTNSYESQSDNTNRSPSPLPMIILSSATQFH